MAVPKRIKQGGAYYRGYQCNVGATPGDHTIAITNTKGVAVNGITFTPDAYGAGDSMKLTHYNDTTGTGQVIAIIAEDIYNMGKGVTISLDFPAAEMVNSGECLLFTYVNTASVAMNVYLVAEYIGLKKTA